MRKCTRCGGSGHFGKYCDNIVDPASGECFNEGFDENVGQQPVATYDENDGQQPVATDEEFDEVPNDDGQQPPDFEDDPKYRPNDDPVQMMIQVRLRMVTNLLSFSAVGSKKTLKVLTTKSRREVAMSTRSTGSKVVARSSRIKHKRQHYL
ncbi:hypothetical protein VPH35_059021 [Triticum aestivum]